MVTIIFISAERDAISISFSRNEDLNTSHQYGKWHVDTNAVELNNAGLTKANV
ncbi:MAG: hypothetical protein ACR2KZ_09430 [Segetibacter sp.]